MCRAAQVVFARKGAHAIVSDVLTEARMSRRSFYEFFTSIQDLIVRMNRAWALTLADWDPPHATWMAYAFSPSTVYLLDEMHSPQEAFEEAVRVASRAASHGWKAPTENELVDWFAALMRGVPASAAPAEVTP